MPLEPPGPGVDDKAADPTDLISPTLGCAAAARISAFSILVELFQLAFLNAAKTDRLHSFSSIPSDLRETSVSLANVAGVWWVLYLRHKSAFSQGNP